MPDRYYDSNLGAHHDDLSLDNDNASNHNTNVNNGRYADSASFDNHSNYTSYDANEFYSSSTIVKDTILPLHRPINILEKLLNLYDKTKYNNFKQDFSGKLVLDNSIKDDGYLRSSTLSFIEIYIPKLDFVREILYIIGNIQEMMILTDLNESSEAENLINNKYFKDIKQFDDIIQHKILKLQEILDFHSDDTLQFLPPPNELMDSTFSVDSETTNNEPIVNTNEPMTLEDGTLETDQEFLARKEGSDLLNEYPIDIPTPQQVNDVIDAVNTFYGRVVTMHESYVGMKENVVKFQEERCIYFEVIKYLNRKTERERQESQGRHVQSSRLNATLNEPVDNTFGRFTDDVEHMSANDPMADDFEIIDEEYTTPNIPSNIYVTEENEGFSIRENLEDNVLTQFGGYLIYGSILKTRIHTVELLSNRATRGNLVFYHSELPNFYGDINNTTHQLKEFFVIYTHGNNLKKKIEKIIDSLDGTLMSRDNSQESLSNINENIQSIENILSLTERQLFVELIALQDQIPKWMNILNKEFNVLKMLATIDNTSQSTNDFKSMSSSVIIKGWIPQDRQMIFANYLKYKFSSIHPELPINYLAISEIPILENYPLLPTHLNNNILTNKQKKLIPPTHFNSYKNPFTSAFQGIVDAYGTSRYKEINPAVPTIVTFPFMFSIMFGDIGHGLILFIISLVLVLNSKKIYKHTLDNEILAMAYSGRFILLMMGLFSIYIGLLYNDMFGKTLTLFKTGWEWKKQDEGSYITATKIDGYSYPFGMDYGWHNTENGLLFTNSYKMKLSIIMGFCHMLYSLFFSLNNYIYFQSYVDIVGNFLPGLIFMCCIFGYLTICIIFKWTINWTDPANPREAPSLLNMLINMFLKPGSIDAPLFKGQKIVQLVLLLISLICVPWLLIYKPYYLYKENLKSKAKGYKSAEHEIQDLLRIKQEQESSHESDDLVITSVNANDFEEFELGDLIIHQIIHTIEFCLNCISHTASYLRLWALSLAHQQLSIVLWEMTLQNGLSVGAGYSSGGFKEVLSLIVLFTMWFVLTCAILVGMEGTSAMLHALRLHWVEAMSKHFIGEGIPFAAFKLSD